ncbi:MAG: hypothetical protein ACREIM_00645 [Nitrospiraceae bacterium]
MNNFIMLLALATFFAAGTALWVTLTFFNHERALRRQKASVVRAQLLGHLRSLREVIVPRSRPLESGQKEAFEPLQFLWMQTDLLDPEEIRVISHCGATLLALRHAPSLNHTQGRFAQALIDESCVLLEQTQREATRALRVEQASWTGSLQALLAAWLAGHDRRDQHEQVRLPTPSGIREP